MRGIDGTAEVSGAAPGKGRYPHFMLKEIHDQPTAIGDTLTRLLDPEVGVLALPPLPFDLAKVERVTLVACGTSHHAAMVAKYWIEEIAEVPVDLDIASEFLTRRAPRAKGGLAVFVSQSGETADTLAALRASRDAGMHTVAVVNVAGSAMAREADVALPTFAGPEISIASTKAFTTQLVVLACLAIGLGKARGVLGREAEASLAKALVEVPSQVAEILRNDGAIRAIAGELAEASHAVYIGRGTAYPIALEGALKLKETSYIHAEGFAAGELNHGPIAMIGDGLPVVAVVPPGDLFEKTAANAREAIACGGKVVFVSDAAGVAAFRDAAFATVTLPASSRFVAPILYAVPLQLLAYHVAALRGGDVDRPRHLAKSVAK